jgi:hypothetical protein
MTAVELSCLRYAVASLPPCRCALHHDDQCAHSLARNNRVLQLAISSSERPRLGGSAPCAHQTLHEVEAQGTAGLPLVREGGAS